MSSLHLLPSLTALAACLLVACGNKDAVGIDIGDTRLYPTLATDEVSTFITDSGYTRYHITADRWLMYENADTPYWKFPEGIFLEQFNDTMAIIATFRADSALYYSTRKIWKFDGRVNMRNTQGNRFATPQLYWDQNLKKIYSDSFMHIERDNRFIEGYGFESNEQITEYTILKPQMILPVERRRPVVNDSTPAPEPAEQNLPSSPSSGPAAEAQPANIGMPAMEHPQPISSDTNLLYLNRQKKLQNQ